MPDQLIGALTGLVEGHFPVAAPAKYADDSVERLATRRVHSANAAIPIDSNPANATKGVSIFAKQDSPVIAVNDGKILKVGTSQKLGRYVELQDSTGNIYTYAAAGLDPEAVSGAQAGQADRRATSPRSCRSRRRPSRSPRRAPASSRRPESRARPPPTKVVKSQPKSQPITLPALKPAAAGPAAAQRRPRRWSRSGCSPTRRGPPPTPPAAASSSRTRQPRSPTSATTSPTSCTSGATSTRCSRSRPARSSSPGTILGRIAAVDPDVGLAPGVHDPAGRARTPRRSTPSRSSTAGSCSRPPPSTAPPGVDPFFGPGAKNPTHRPAAADVQGAAHRPAC